MGVCPWSLHVCGWYITKLLILYQATLPNLFTISRNVLIELLRPVLYVMSSTKGLVWFVCSLFIALPFLSLSDPTAQARNSGKMLKGSMDNRQLYLIPDFSRISSRFVHLQSCWLRISITEFLLYWDIVPQALHTLGLLSWSYVRFCQRRHLLRCSCDCCI